MLRARRGSALTAWDGNLDALHGSPWMNLPEVASPTRLEQYGTCGFRFLMATLLRVRVPEEPRDREGIDPMVRGNLMHQTLEDFFREQQQAQRPAVGEAWTAADEAHALSVLEGHLEVARRRGLIGLPVFARKDERVLQADLVAFLKQDTLFRRETGAVPYAFEKRIEAKAPGGQRFTGFIDRIDGSPGGDAVWIVDYKTGQRLGENPSDPLAGGTRLQRPVYLLAAPDGTRATALYWYITERGGFAQERYAATAATAALFAETLDAISDGVRSGSFPAVPGELNEHRDKFGNCLFCDFTRICGRARGEDFERKASDAGVAPWAGVAQAAAPPGGSV
jgi:hypothetical protein